jgi:hypothetical protein
MLRHKAFLLLLIPVFIVSCGGPDQQALNTYFKACRNGDNPAMAAVSAVEFPEKVTSWEVVEIGPESVVPFAFKEMSRTKRLAEMDLKNIAEEDYLYVSDNQHLYKRYQAAIEKDPDVELKDELLEFQQKFNDIRKRGEEADKAVEEANRALNREKSAAGISLMGATVTGELDGDVAVKEARVNVNGKPYRITLKNYNLADKQGNKARSRWVITDVQAGSG